MRRGGERVARAAIITEGGSNSSIMGSRERIAHSL